MPLLLLFLPGISSREYNSSFWSKPSLLLEHSKAVINLQVASQNARYAIPKCVCWFFSDISTVSYSMVFTLGQGLTVLWPSLPTQFLFWNKLDAVVSKAYITFNNVPPPLVHIQVEMSQGHEVSISPTSWGNVEGLTAHLSRFTWTHTLHFQKHIMESYATWKSWWFLWSPVQSGGGAH